MQRYDLQSIYYGVTEHTDIKPANFFEIGSRDGHDAAAIATAFGLSHASCYLFEANPEACVGISKTYPDMNLYNNAINDVTGSLVFHLEPGNIGMSSLLEKHEHTEGMREVNVECIRMDEFIESAGIVSIDTAKVDVEGLTLPVLKSFGKHIHRLQSVQLEMEHREVWKGQALFAECKEWLEANGFVMLMFTLLRQVQSDSFWVRKERLLI